MPLGSWYRDSLGPGDIKLDAGLAFYPGETGFAQPSGLNPVKTGLKWAKLGTTYSRFLDF